MSRGAKIALLVVVVIAALLAINAVIVDGETKDAEVTIDGGQILKLPGGEVQVFEQGPSATGPRAVRAPIVLVHCYSCSLHWYERLAPILARTHRVIRVDLLGHGGSEKPSSGYEITEQAALLAGALDRLGVQGAVIVGHSTGFDVAVALAEQASQLVDRLVDIGEAVDNETLELPLLTRVAYWPLIGEAAWRLTPDAAIRSGYESLFAPGFELENGFANPDQVVEDFRAMTNASFEETHEAQQDYVKEIPLDDRIRTVAIPLLVIFGEEDDSWEDPVAAAEAFSSVPGARIATMPGAGHSPNVEKPAATARLIEEFAAEAGDEALSPPRRGRENRAGRGKQGERRSERR